MEFLAPPCQPTKVQSGWCWTAVRRGWTAGWLDLVASRLCTHVPLIQPRAGGGQLGGQLGPVKHVGMVKSKIYCSPFFSSSFLNLSQSVLFDAPSLISCISCGRCSKSGTSWHPEMPSVYHTWLTSQQASHLLPGDGHLALRHHSGVYREQLRCQARAERRILTN